jgi:hypothetical protein
MDALPPLPVAEIVSTASATKGQPRPDEVRIVAYTTGYASGDNTPQGSTQTTIGDRWGRAGGNGTFDNPITVAVGHTITKGVDIPDYPAGTKFYVPYLRKYFSVQDSCGDGKTPQNGPCHTGYQGHVWLDFYIGDIDGDAAKACENGITDLHLVIQNPAPNYAVIPGSVYGSGCTVYSEDVVSQEVTEAASDRK